MNHRFRNRAFHSFVVALVFLCVSATAHAQLDENCVVSVLNRTAQVAPDGTWLVPNVPGGFGTVRARVTCVESGVTRSGQSDFFTLPANGAMNLPTIILGPVDPIPESLDLTAPTMTLNGVGSTVQLTVTATFPDGSSADMTASSTGTNYTSTSPAIATVSDDGLVTALLSGNIIVSSMQCATLPL